MPYSITIPKFSITNIRLNSLIVSKFHFYLKNTHEKPPKRRFGGLFNAYEYFKESLIAPCPNVRVVLFVGP